MGNRALGRRRSSKRFNRKLSGLRGVVGNDSQNSFATYSEGTFETEAEVLGPHRSRLSRWLSTRMYYSPDDISATHFQRLWRGYFFRQVCG